MDDNQGFGSIYKTSGIIITLISSLLITTFVLFYETILREGPSFGENDKPIIFLISHSNFLLWLLVVTIEMVFCLCIIPYIIYNIRIFFIRYNLSLKEGLVNFILIIFFICSISLVTFLLGKVDIITDLENSKFVNHASIKIGSIIFCGYLSAGCCTFLLLLQNTVITKMKISALIDYLNYIDIKKRMQFMLGILGSIITLSTVATILLQKSLNAKNFPKEFVYAYGLFNTFSIALIYLPVFFNLKSLGRKFIDKEIKKAIELDTDIEKLSKQKQFYEQLFELNEDYLSIGKNAIPILAPLLSTLLSL